MCEQKFEQEQNPLTPGRKILWIVAPEDEERISADISAFLENYQVRIVYNNLRTCDEISEWERTRCDTPEAILSQIEELQPGDCYILDSLELVCRPGKADFNTELVSFGKKLFQLASSCGVDCMIVAFKRSRKVMEKLQLPMPTYLLELQAAADIDWELRLLLELQAAEKAVIVFEDEQLLLPSLTVVEPVQLYLQVSGHKYKIANRSTTFKTGEE